MSRARCRPIPFALDHPVSSPDKPMPTVLRVGPYRFFFYSGDGHEPAHVHVERDQAVAKFWLDPVYLARSGGYGRSELRKIGRLVSDHAEELLEAWNDYFGA